jgi:hypothetical protein
MAKRVEKGPTTEARIIGAEDLKKLTRRVAGLEAEIAKSRGLISDVIVKAEAQKNLHRRAYKDIRRLEKMDAVSLLDYWVHFEAYFEYLGLAQKMEASPDVEPPAERKARARKAIQAETEDEAAGNVTALRA